LQSADAAGKTAVTRPKKTIPKMYYFMIEKKKKSIPITRS